MKTNQGIVDNFNEMMPMKLPEHSVCSISDS